MNPNVIPLSHLNLPVKTGLFLEKPLQASDLDKVLPSVISAAIEKERWSFACGETEEDEVDLMTEEVAAADGLMPVILYQAQRTMRLALGASAPLAWQRDDASLSAYRAIAGEEATAPIHLWALFAHFALESLVKAQPKEDMKLGKSVSLTKWRQAFLADIPRGELQPVANRQPARTGT